jgi:hypothetical protein
MKSLRAFCVFVAVTAMAEASLAADPRYPNWPCAQAKVPEISLAAVWNGPALDDATNKWRDNPKISPLVARLAARRTPLDQAEKEIVGFLQETPSEKAERGKLVFAGLFETLNAERTAVINGLERTTSKQREAAEKVRADTVALQSLQDQQTKDQAKIDELSNQLIWETRIFEDRRRVIKFVCEVPTAIDQRLFALARVIQQEME